jgi:hypothetical protein
LQDYRVRLVYNEHVLPLPGCNSSSSSGGLDCSLQEFLDVVVGDKILYERFKRLCDGSADAADDQSILMAGDGVSDHSMHKSLSSSSSTSDASSSSSSSSSGSVGVGGWAGLSAVGLQESAQGLQLETADGLPLLLPAADEHFGPAVWF